MSADDVIDRFTGAATAEPPLQPGERPLTIFNPKVRYDPTAAEDYIRTRAPLYGVDPDTAVKVARSEGLKTYIGDGGSSFGPFQLHYGNIAPGGNAVSGLGDEFTKATGLHARDESTWRQQIDFALVHASKNGWGAFHGAANSGIGEFAGIGGTDATAAARQPSARPDFFSGAHTPQDVEKAMERMLVWQTSPDLPPYKTEVKPAPTPASVQALPQTPGAVEASRPVEWGAGLNTLSGMAFGAGPQAAGLGRAIRGVAADIGDYKGVVPSLSQFPAYYAAGRDLASQAREEYAKENPGTSLATDLAGGVVPALAGVGALTTAGRLAAAPLLRAAPSAAPAVEGVGNFFTGQAGNFNSIPGGIARVGSWTGAGAAQGAAAGAAQTGITGGDVGDNALTGAKVGAALGVPLGWAGNALAAPFRAEVNPAMGRLAQEAEARGVQLPGAALTDNKGVQKLAGLGSGTVSKELADKVDTVVREQYAQLERTAGTALDQQFRREMLQLRGEIASAQYLDAGDKRALLDVIKRANNPNGALSGRDIVGFTRASGKLNDMQSNADLKPFASRIMDSLMGVMERQNPGAYNAMRDVRAQVSAWGNVLSRTPHKLWPQIIQSVGKGAFAGELAGEVLAGGAVHGLLTGELSPLAAAQMLHSGSVVPLIMAGAGATAGYGARRAMGAFVNTPTYGNILMGGGLPALPNAGIPPLVQLYNREPQ